MHTDSIDDYFIYIIKVQKSTDFKSQEKRERKTGHACSGGQIGRKIWNSTKKNFKPIVKDRYEEKKPLELSDIF